MLRALGVRLHKPRNKPWTAAEWAIVSSGEPRTVVARGSISPPTTYTEPEALRHLYEAIVNAVRENDVTRTLVWEMEGNARVTSASRPRVRAEGVVCAAATHAGSTVELVMWATIASRSGAHHSKDDYSSAMSVCGIPVDDADSRAVLVAVAALER